jgi:GNAT superfamily N-acetyltransferase
MFLDPRDTNALTHAIEENEAELLLAMGRAGGGEERRDAELTWTIGGSPIAYHNAVVRAALEPGRVDAAIEQSLALMRAKGVPGSWHVGPSMRPAELGARLAAHGFVDGGPEPGMAVELDRLVAPSPVPGLAIERVRDDAGLAAFQAVLTSGFGEGEIEARWTCEMYRRIGLGDDVPWRHVLARLEGEPVATASLFVAAGIAGVYFVCTTPAFRRRGIGASITYAALEQARPLGLRVAVLGASEAGRPVYERLGFRAICDVHVYEWAP